MATNESDRPLTFFYDIACTLGDNYSEDTLYFHPYWRRAKAANYTRQELQANPNRAQAFESQSDYCATAYWYMDKPANGLPPLAKVAERIKDLP